MNSSLTSMKIVRSTRRLWLAQTAALGATAYLGSTGWGQDSATQAAGSKLIVRQERPFNAEPGLPELVKNYFTPVEQFYVRSHGDVPTVDEKTFRLKISGLVNRELEFSVDQLKEKFDTHKVAATLTCAGNRRQEMSAIKKVAGVQWDAGAIGHATWTGALLSEVLKAAELKPEAKHVWFDGLDPIKEKDGSEAPFGGSIPLGKALAHEGRDLPSLLAHSMNDKPLTPAHGAPLRSLVPGFIGARSVKWLAKIVVSDRSSPNHYVAEAYKLIQTDDKEEVAKAEPIYEFPLNVAIGLPTDGVKLKAGRQEISGYVLPSGTPNSFCQEIELSVDNGRNWRSVKTLASDPITAASTFSWRLWTANVDILKGRQTLIARAVDTAGKSTPEQGPWNLKGYMYNAWHRVRVEGV
ncbi:TMAO/DMSO reductase [Anatilimnocola aggregata]|uniref:TMAO/DMSO reductase n=1 Tax=Anatilimnocola aggregata TaxID=2528021 RepID=A0A517YBV8_9BACT|nr:molybdopterin-dependent oxidoreductase [Anatilimnocola aggregata]QDU27725.1 TMAO/DMSO reductase [Anatilimnocola aggregata]